MKLKKCIRANIIRLYLHVYLILIMSVPIMHHDINKKNFSTFFKRAELSELSTVVAVKILWRLFHTSTIKTLTWHNSEIKCDLKIKFCTDVYFYETLCLFMRHHFLYLCKNGRIPWFSNLSKNYRSKIPWRVYFL